MSTIYATFRDKESADRALTKLAALDYDAKEISVIVREDIEKTRNEARKGVITGAIVGGVTGGIAGLLLGIGAVTVAGLSPLLIAGPLAAALGITAIGAATIEGAATGALGGGLVGALVGMGIPKETAQAYEASIKEGQLLLGVPAREGVDEEIVNKIFVDEKAENIYISVK